MGISFKKEASLRLNTKKKDKYADKDKYKDKDRVPGGWLNTQLIYLKMFGQNLSPSIYRRNTRLHFLHTPDIIQTIILRTLYFKGRDYHAPRGSKDKFFGVAVIFTEFWANLARNAPIPCAVF